MAADTWEDIYRKKDTKELYMTFRGTNNSTYGQKKLALKILEERNFNFEDIEQQQKVWKEQSIKKEKEFEKRNPILTALHTRRGYILSMVAMILFLLSYTPGIFDEINNFPLEMLLFLSSWYGSLVIFFFLGLIKQMRIFKKKELKST